MEGKRFVFVTTELWWIDGPVTERSRQEGRVLVEMGLEQIDPAPVNGHGWGVRKVVAV